ncbi:MAG: DUF1579 family protein [Telluria sp.]
MRFSIHPRAAIAACLVAAFAGQPATAATPVTPGVHDGQHDFDFNLGTWKTHIRRLVHPLSGDQSSVELNGTVTVRPVWGGRAQLEEIETDGPQGHWQGATLFLYNPGAHQWSQTFFDSAHPTPEPGLVGAFANGKGELYAQDVLNGKAVLVRGTWSDIKPDSHRYEEAYSADGGRTWETAFAARLERISR